MIEAHELTKRYSDTTAVHSLSFTIAPGTVTGFLGPNGAGKSTTMRMIMGLDRPTSGTVTVNGKPYRQHRAPLREVGALLEASAVHPGRSARSHLRSMAATHNIKASRVSEVIEMTGLAGVATKRVGGFSLGMGQRLGIAAASLLVASGANVKAVQRMLGHASAAMTLDVYSGLFDDDLGALADRMDLAHEASVTRRHGA
jgi:ABC-2 type transport system ATP-binding protein